MYNADDIIHVLRQRPFQRVEVLLSSGETITLAHPEQAVVTDTDAVLIVVPGERQGRHSWQIVGLDHIVSLTANSEVQKDDSPNVD